MSQAKGSEVLVEAVIIDGSVSWNGLPNNGTPILLDAELAKAYVNAGIAKYVSDAKIKPVVVPTTFERDDKETE
jgi:hypothetical protein